MLRLVTTLLLPTPLGDAVLRFSKALLLLSVTVYAFFWLLGPNGDLYLPPRGTCGGGSEKAQLNRTAADLRDLGTMVLARQAELSVPPEAPNLRAEHQEPGSEVDLSRYRRVSFDEISAYLEEGGIVAESIPRRDGWGNEIELFLPGESISSGGVLLRSAGCDGRFETDLYETGAFPPDRSHQDIVWRDGLFVRWPG